MRNCAFPADSSRQINYREVQLLLMLLSAGCFHGRHELSGIAMAKVKGQTKQYEGNAKSSSPGDERPWIGKYGGLLCNLGLGSLPR